MMLAFGFLVFFVICIAGAYIAMEETVGSKIAYRTLLYTIPWLLFGFALPVISLSLFGKYGWVSIHILSAVSFSSWFFSWFFRKQKAGALLLDIGKTSQISSLLVLLVWIAFFAYVFSKILSFFHPFENGVSQYTSLKQDISAIVSYWTSAIFLTATALNKLELRENGICSMYSLIKWQKISSYAWEPAKPNVVTIRFKQKNPLWPRFMSLAIPEKHKGVVSHILDEQLTDTSLTTPMQPPAES